MGFTAKTAVATLDYDFTGLDIPELDGVKGVTPEPTLEQIRTMRYRLRELFKVDDDDDPDALRKRIASLTLDEIKDRDDEMAEIYADACSQKPSTAQILALPHRIMSAYIGYLSEEMLTPSAGSSDSSSSRAPLKSVG